MRIGITGCGTAGPAAALMLRSLGHEVTIIERAADLHPIGAGLLLQPTGQSVLHRLGVLEGVRSLAAPIRRLHGINQRGRTVLFARYADLDPRIVGLGVHRGALFSVLESRVRREGIPIVTGFDAATYARRPDGCMEVRDRTGEPLGPFDLLVIADGARSALREQSGLVKRAERYPWGALWFVADDPAGAFGDTLFQVYRGTRTMIGFLPCGRPAPDASPTVSLFWSVRLDRVDDVVAAGLDAFRDAALSLCPGAAPVLEQVQSMDDLIVAAYHDVVLRRPYDLDAGPIAVLGDAAHAMSPQLGQGVNLALMDAAALADAIRSHSALPDALAAFARARAGSTAYYQRASRWLTPLFQSGHEWLTPIRDLLWNPMCRFPPTRRAMLDSLAGIKTGVWPWNRIEIEACAKHIGRSG